VTEITRGAVWFRMGPPRRLLGRSVRGYAIRWGVLVPPAGGPARLLALDAEGRKSLAGARREYGQALREVLVVAGSAVPPPVDLAQPLWPSASDALVASREAGWRQTRSNLRAITSRMAFDVAALEQRSRTALRSAVAAFNYLEDTDLALEAHMQAHAIGEFVAGLFGCRAQREDGHWFDVCPLSLMHLRVGLSPGFVARRHCSVCDGDLADCEHLPGVAYPVVAARDPGGACTICGTVGCAAHPAGTSHLVAAHAVIREADRLDEISTVARPRDPLARYDGVEIPGEQVATLPGSDAPDAVLECKRCISPCTGFTAVEEALGFV
jgi:hypothetical protein